MAGSEPTLVGDFPHEEVEAKKKKKLASHPHCWQMGLTSLNLASQNGHKAVVELLLGKGANIEATNEVRMPFRRLTELKKNTENEVKYIDLWRNGRLRKGRTSKNKNT